MIDCVDRELRHGAVLVIDALETMSASVDRMARLLDEAAGTHVQINLYASYLGGSAFPLHQDDHDVVVVQIAGNRRWSLSRPSGAASLQLRDQSTPELALPNMEVTLSRGDLLRVPRGWWHRAMGAGRDSIHWSVSYRRPTGLDLVDVLKAALADDPMFRADLPWPPDERFSAAVRRLASALGDVLDGDQRLIDAARQHFQRSANARRGDHRLTPEVSPDPTEHEAIDGEGLGAP